MIYYFIAGAVIVACIFIWIRWYAQRIYRNAYAMGARTFMIWNQSRGVMSEGEYADLINKYPEDALPIIKHKKNGKTIFCGVVLLEKRGGSI